MEMLLRTLGNSRETEAVTAAGQKTNLGDFYHRFTELLWDQPHSVPSLPATDTLTGPREGAEHTRGPRLHKPLTTQQSL